MHEIPKEPEETIDLSFDATSEGLGQAANHIRGAIITSFAHVEFMCTDLIARCLNHPIYAPTLDGRFPFPLQRKLNLAKTLFSIAGPLNRFHAEALLLINRLLDFERTRHFMAHGMMIVDAADASSLNIHFRIYEHVKGGQVALATMDVSPEGLAEESREIGLYGAKMTDFFLRVLTETGLPPAPLILES
jgi:hypothetical protein